MNKRKAEYTFKHNMKLSRHNWLRLTPAYSAKAVHHILDRLPDAKTILDPFSGSGTTGLVCIERGLQCTLLDINPFLIWLAKVKTANYTGKQLKNVTKIACEITKKTQSGTLWLPPISNISRWWPESRLSGLAKIHQAISTVYPDSCREKDLLLIAFCRLVIEWSNAAFNHQSMSFKNAPHEVSGLDERALSGYFLCVVEEIVAAAQQKIKNNLTVNLSDAREMNFSGRKRYDAVITSPPYPNRMSYIRELRPYMYWLGYLKQSREAGELDWQAIGGTWGIATSRLKNWKPGGVKINYDGFEEIITGIGTKSPLLTSYVHKYFEDIACHIQNLRPRIRKNGQVFYIVGNSKFYDTLVPTEKIYAALLQQHHFTDVEIEVLRKRNSKKELFEFIVSARKS